MCKIFIIICSIILFAVSTVRAQSFLDVNENHPNYEAIESLKTYGIIKGYEDGSFKPDQTVNRAEALKIILLGSSITVNDKNEKSIFPDVSTTDWFAPFVNKAKNLGIVKGNPDGRFLPANNINLVEALKILLNTNGVHLSLQAPSAKPYADVEINEWFTPYCVYAYENKLLDQKPHENINPDKAITRAELAELMFRMKNILKNEASNSTFASYYSDTFDGQNTANGDIYDKNLYTAGHKEFDFGTKVKVTNTLNNKSVIVTINDRGPKAENRTIELSKMAFQTISPLSKNFIPVAIEIINESNPADTTLTNIENSPEICQKIKDNNVIDVNFFTNPEENINLVLYTELKTIYYENEVVDISGKITNSLSTEINAFIKDEKGQTTFFTAPITDGNFMIQIDAGTSGQKQITIMPNDKTSNYTADIEVINQFCNDEVNDRTVKTANNYKFAIENNEVILRWNLDKTANISRVIFIQGDNKIIRYFSKQKKGYKLFLKDFMHFAYGNFTVRVDTAYSQTENIVNPNTNWQLGENQTFIANQHHYLIKNDNYIETNNLPNFYGFGGDIAFSVRTKAKIRPEIALITPNGSIEFINITSNESSENPFGIKTIAPNEKMDIKHTPKEHGTYILELNHESGVAVLNVPIYEQDIIPLIPDYRDLEANISATMVESIPSSLSVELLNLINQDREVINVNKLELDDKLSLLAQDRADDMAKNNYISHWNQSGQDSNDLRVSYGVKSAVSENLAKESNIKFAHLGLMRSALHRANILDDHWTKLGLGFAKSSDNQLITVEIFSATPINTEDLPKLREEILEMINAKRSEFLLPSATLTSIAQSWSEKMSNDNFFDFKDTSDKTLSDAIRDSGVVQTVGTFIVGNTSWIDARTSIMDHTEIINDRWQKLGVGIAQDADGIIKITLLYSE